MDMINGVYTPEWVGDGVGGLFKLLYFMLFYTSTNTNHPFERIRVSQYLHNPMPITSYRCIINTSPGYLFNLAINTFSPTSSSVQI